MSAKVITEKDKELFDLVVECAEKATGVSRMEFLSRCRKRYIINVRYSIIRYLVMKGFSRKNIGKLLGGYDHSTMTSANTAFKNAQHVYRITGAKNSLVETYDSIRLAVRDMLPEKIQLANRGMCLAMTENGSNLYAILGRINVKQYERIN